ncbi:WAS/WASL-interacting protein family member 1-like [Schistocerca serialis cubense]|uniref:WAS/WASL-interacting protein family member 1-like n=1 Tax=Schistocerca serialis cubense TaxID=2023355 RepID=UPI00214E1AD2|nr:WAS/WASL-interacting protein family member 1-like [Schistocerca serialis cubense]
MATSPASSASGGGRENRRSVARHVVAAAAAAAAAIRSRWERECDGGGGGGGGGGGSGGRNYLRAAWRVTHLPAALRSQQAHHLDGPSVLGESSASTIRAIVSAPRGGNSARRQFSVVGTGLERRAPPRQLRWKTAIEPREWNRTGVFVPGRQTEIVPGAARPQLLRRKGDRAMRCGAVRRRGRTKAWPAVPLSQPAPPLAPANNYSSLGDEERASRPIQLPPPPPTPCRGGATPPFYSALPLSPGTGCAFGPGAAPPLPSNPTRR